MLKKGLNEVLFKGKIFDVIQKCFHLHSDDKVRAYEVVKLHNAAAIVPYLEDEGKILLIKQYRQAVGKMLDEIPAGKIDKGETPIECVRRELKEETGYNIIGDLKLLAPITPTPGCVDETIFIYFANVGNQQQQSPDDDERIEVFKLSISEAIEMIARQEIVDAKTIIGILMVDRMMRQSEKHRPIVESDDDYVCGSPS